MSLRQAGEPAIADGWIELPAEDEDGRSVTIRVSVLAVAAYADHRGLVGPDDVLLFAAVNDILDAASAAAARGFADMIVIRASDLSR